MALDYCGSVGIMAGAFFGQLVEMKYVKVNLSNDNWQKTSIPKTILRIVLTAVMLVFFFVPVLRY